MLGTIYAFPTSHPIKKLQPLVITITRHLKNLKIQQAIFLIKKNYKPQLPPTILAKETKDYKLLHTRQYIIQKGGRENKQHPFIPRY